ncbi:hypothetical protein [Nostoc sp. UHCC 0302]
MKFLFNFLKAIAALNINANVIFCQPLGKLKAGDFFEVNQPLFDL